MQQVSQAGGIVLAASPSFYSKPLTIDDLIKTVTHRILKFVDIKINSFEWGK
jgi:4-hydroxy-3-polyprenylbenzoate decarboxylase